LSMHEKNIGDGQEAQQPSFVARARWLVVSLAGVLGLFALNLCAPGGVASQLHEVDARTQRLQETLGAFGLGETPFEHKDTDEHMQMLAKLSSGHRAEVEHTKAEDAGHKKTAAVQKGAGLSMVAFLITLVLAAFMMKLASHVHMKMRNSLGQKICYDEVGGESERADTWSTDRLEATAAVAIAITTTIIISVAVAIGMLFHGR